MDAPKTRGAAIAAKCKDCIHDPAAAGTWREQVAVCSCIDCPLWRFRPLPRNAPPWIASRDPADPPEGWRSLHHDEAIRQLRSAGASILPDGAAVHAHGGTRVPMAMVSPTPAPATPETGTGASQSAMSATP